MSVRPDKYPDTRTEHALGVVLDLLQWRGVEALDAIADLQTALHFLIHSQVPINPSMKAPCALDVNHGAYALHVSLRNANWATIASSNEVALNFSCRWEYTKTGLDSGFGIAEIFQDGFQQGNQPGRGPARRSLKRQRTQRTPAGAFESCVRECSLSSAEEEGSAIRSDTVLMKCSLSCGWVSLPRWINPRPMLTVLRKACGRKPCKEPGMQGFSKPAFCYQLVPSRLLFFHPCIFPDGRMIRATGQGKLHADNLQKFLAACLRARDLQA